NISRERAASFYFRLENENVLIHKALERPLLGWGGWGRARVYDEEGNDLTTTDGLWIIVLGNQGALGLVALGIAIGLPAALVFFAFPVKVWARPQFAPAIVLAMTLVLYLIDGLANAMINPIFMLIAGGLNSLSISPVWRGLRTSVDALAIGGVGQSGPVTFRAQPGIGVRAVAKYGPGPLADADLRAPNDCGVDHTCPAP
ncbi:MAG TPA: hypothetical protein VGP68_21960, partial [Gemmataceae bacterium]|nr:hypothetical protein [Gemmataceae bacterium]